MPCRSVETRDEPKDQIQPATCQHRQEKLLHKLLHTPPPNSLSSILNCTRFQILTPAQTSKYTQNPTTSFSHAPSPGQAPASLIWTKAVLFAVLVPGSRPSSHSLSSLKQPPEGAREHLSQAPPPPLPTALQGSHLTESKNPNAPAAHKALHNLVDHLPPFPPPSLPLLTLLQLHGASGCSASTAGQVLAQDICTGCALSRPLFSQIF